MADDSVIKSFLISLGFKVDDQSHKKFVSAIREATTQSLLMADALEEAGKKVIEFARGIDEGLEKLYWQSFRTGTAAENLAKFSFAMGQLGLSAGEAGAMVESLNNFMLTKGVGATSYIASLIGADNVTKDMTHNLQELGKHWKTLIDAGQGPRAFAEAGVLGITPKQVQSLTLNIEKAAEAHEDAVKRMHINYQDATEGAAKFMNQYRLLNADIELLGIKLAAELNDKLGPDIKRLHDYLLDHSDEIIKFIEDMFRWFEKVAIVVNDVVQALGGWERVIGAILVLKFATWAWEATAGVRALAGALTAMNAAGVASQAGLLPLLRTLGGLAALAGLAYEVNEGAEWLERKTWGKDEQDARKKFQEEHSPIKKWVQSILPSWAGGTAEKKPEEKPVPEQHPATGDVTGLGATPLGNLISSGEGDYNSVNRGAAGGYKAGTEDLASKTVAEVMADQAAQKYNAAGRYQIIRETMKSAFETMHLKGTEKFDAAMQDRILSEYLAGSKRPELQAYLHGKSNDIMAAGGALSKEWASFVDPNTGKGAYDQDGVNRASISAQRSLEALRKTREIVMAADKAAAEKAKLGDTNVAGVGGKGEATPPGVPAPETPKVGDGAKVAYLDRDIKPDAAVNGGKGDVHLAQNTTVNVSGAGDPHATASAVASAQDRVNQNLVRHTKTAVA